MLEQTIQKAQRNPRKLFIVDGLGAILSAFLLGVVLVKLEHLFGIPRSTLYFLAFLPCLFAIYDLFCYKKNSNLGVFLKGIAFANLAYCVLSIGLAIFHFQTLTYLAWIYIIGEIIILILLSILEIKVANKLKN